MASTGDGTQETDPFEGTPLSPNLLGALFGLMDVVVFSMVGLLVLEDPVAGGATGLMIGAGVALSIPLLLTETDDERSPGSNSTGTLRSFHRLAAGFSLSIGGLASFTALMTDQSLAIAIPAGLLVVGVAYIPLAFLLDNRSL